MITIYVCGSSGDNSREIAAVKKAVPDAQVLVEGEDAFVYALTPEALRNTLEDLQGEADSPVDASKVSDEQLIGFAEDWVGSSLDDCVVDNMRDQIADGYFHEEEEEDE